MQKLDKIPHLQCVNGRYQFRRRIPEDVRAAFEHKTERVITLKAQDPTDLKALVFQHAKAFDREVAAARKQLALSQAPAPSEEDAPALGERYYASALASDEVLRDEGLSEAEHGELNNVLTELLGARRRAAARGDFTGAQDLLDAVLHAERMREPDDPSLVRFLCKALLHSDIRALDAQLARQRGEYIPTPEFPQRLRGRYVGEDIRGEAGYFDSMYELWKAEVAPRKKTLYEAELVLRRLGVFCGADDSPFYSTLLTNRDGKKEATCTPRPRLHLLDVPRGLAVEFKGALLIEGKLSKKGLAKQTARKQLGLLGAIVEHSLLKKQPLTQHVPVQNPFHRIWSRPFVSWCWYQTAENAAMIPSQGKSRPERVSQIRFIDLVAIRHLDRKPSSFRRDQRRASHAPRRTRRKRRPSTNLSSIHGERTSRQTSAASRKTSSAGRSP